MKIAAVDIGSNAVRLFVAHGHEEKDQILLEKVLHTRVPIRLGEDVFMFGKVSKEKMDQLSWAIQGFDCIVKALGIDVMRICATSALRSAENRDEVLKFVQKRTGKKIDILSGAREAEMIFGNFEFYELPKEHHYLFIDVGGGSTELTIIEKGVKKASQSFETGTVRMLLNEQSKLPSAIFEWLQKELNPRMKYEAIATGGNINSAMKILDKKQREPVGIEELQSLLKTLNKLSKTQRMKKFKLREDRADVIVPALNIYNQIAVAAKVQSLIAPKFGLADGIVLDWMKSKDYHKVKFISA